MARLMARRAAWLLVRELRGRHRLLLLLVPGPDLLRQAGQVCCHAGDACGLLQLLPLLLLRQLLLLLLVVVGW